MRLVPIQDVSVGARLAQPIFGASGQPLLNVGAELKAEYLEMLRQRGTTALYIEDLDTSDIKVPMPLSAQTRSAVTAHLGAAFNEITGRTENLRSSYVAVARREMEASRFADAIESAVGSGGLNTLVRDMDSMMDELKGQQVLTGLNSIKSHDSYTFQHSIDVTIMGLVLARSLNWEPWRLKAFGMGCMLHDIGKLFIEPSLLNKPGKLTDAEYALIKAHPTVGYDAIKAIGEHFGVLAPLIALQHHERQDGKGYPKGIRGNNELGGNTKGLIHDFGALAAVADVYDALTSCRPYRTGWTPARTIATIERDAGTHFNRAAVEVLLNTVPLYPVLSNVRVVNGKYAGFRGLVAEVSRANLNRPKIRLMHNATGERIDPVEIDLRREMNTKIDAISEADATAPLLKAA